MHTTMLFAHLHDDGVFRVENSIGTGGVVIDTPLCAKLLAASTRLNLESDAKNIDTANMIVQPSNVTSMLDMRTCEEIISLVCACSILGTLLFG